MGNVYQIACSECFVAAWSFAFCGSGSFHSQPPRSLITSLFIIFQVSRIELMGDERMKAET
ncbi:hypothetical protein U0070_013747, partial [Myodes glareolus]